MDDLKSISSNISGRYKWQGWYVYEARWVGIREPGGFVSGAMRIGLRSRCVGINRQVSGFQGPDG
jgi:hypothetical protein